MRIKIAPGCSISRVIKGGWHLAGGHGSIEPEQALRDMAAFVESGITTFDCADIYTGVEALIGEFRRRYPELAVRVQVHSKLVPDLTELASVDAEYVERGIDRSLARLGMERLDLVQLHWWDYAVPGYVDAAMALARLRDKGKIAHIGVTNFDVPRLREIVGAGVPVVALQAQYSVLDARPDHGMTELCRERGIALLCYGTVAGGFLSERWLGRAAPGPELTNRSLIKYRLIIEDFGGWDLFQDLLRALSTIAVKHDVDLATVASRVILDKPAVAAVIVGATNVAHLTQNRRIDGVRLDAADMDVLTDVLRRRRGPDGDVYALERDRRGPHGRIMKYNLHQKGRHATPESQ